MQLFVLKALSEGQPKHSKKGRKKFKRSNKKYLKWSDSRLSFVKVLGNMFENLQVPCTMGLSPQLGCSFAFPALSAGREVRYA